MDANDTLGTFVRCNWASGGFTDFPAACWERLTSCVKGAETASWLTMNTCTNSPTVFRVANVASVQLSEPEGRRAAYERDEMWDAEAKEMERPKWS
jgi:hypothetical protein